MKRSKRIYVLLGVLAIVCIMTLCVSKYEERKEQISNSGEIILEVDPDTVSALSWEFGEDTLSFHKEETWLYDEDEAFPTDEEKIRELLSDFEAFSAAFIIEDVEDFGQYGLDDPVCTIRLETEDTSTEILLGDYSAMDSQRYVSIGDGNVYLAADDPLDDFDADLSDVIRHDEAPAFDRVTAVTFTGTENWQLAYEEDSTDTYCADDVYFTTQDGAVLPLDTSLVDSYVQTVAGLDLTDYVTYNATDEELSSCGLDNPELTISIDYTSEEDEESDEDGEAVTGTFVLHVSRDPEELAAVKEDDDGEESTEEEITAYVRVGDSQILYRITSDEYLSLMDASCDDLRHPEVLSADFADIYQIDLTLDGTDYTLTSADGEDDENRLWYYGEEELDITDFQYALEALTADSFTDEAPSGKEEISLTVYLDNEQYPTVSIELYRYDGSLCLAAVDQQPVSLVERSAVIDLVEAVNAIVLN